MAEEVTDKLDTHAARQQSHRECVAQAVDSEVTLVQICFPHPLSKNIGHGCSREWATGGLRAEKQLWILGSVVIAAMEEIFAQNLDRGWSQW